MQDTGSHKPRCCDTTKDDSSHVCGSTKNKMDNVFWFCVALIGVSYGYQLFIVGMISLETSNHLNIFTHAIFELINTMWWGLLMGVIMVSVVGRIPRDMVMFILGSNRGYRGILRATMAGFLLDLCSHGILMVGMKLYERGANIGQIMAFLLASPWNSFSLTFILFALIGLYWTLMFIVLSMVIAIIVGMLFLWLVKRGVLPDNPVSFEVADGFVFWPEVRRRWQAHDLSFTYIVAMLRDGLHDSKTVIRWLFIGVLLASLIRAFMPDEHFSQWFGPSIAGLGLTILAATLIEVCSEGSTPIAADMVTRANAPGNGFAFLMTGVATDYTEVMVIKETTKSWKLALYLPLLSVPQVVLVAWLINHFTLI